MQPAVAIVEDDIGLRRSIVKGLTEEGFRVCLAVGTGAELLAGFADAAPDVTILDIGLPDSDGRDIAMALRAEGNDQPLLMLTARSNLDDRISGFNAGADDYLPKPFAFEELVLRLRALTRRIVDDASSQSARTILDPVSHRIVYDGHAVDTTPTEFRLLATLLARPGAAVRRHALVAAAWPNSEMVQDNTLDAYMVRLRRKLRDAGSPDTIATVRGVGYRWEPCADD